MSGGALSRNKSTGGSGGGIQNEGTFTESVSCAIHNNTASTSGDDIYNTGTLTLQSVYSGLTLDACQHAITGWYYDGLGDGALTTRWLSHVTTEDKYCIEYTVSTASVSDSLALKAAHGGYHTITVNYLQNGSSTAIATATTVSVADTDAYTVSQKSISGYTYVSADRSLTVDATTDNVTITLYYEVSTEETESNDNSSADSDSDDREGSGSKSTRTKATSTQTSDSSSSSSESTTITVASAQTGDSANLLLWAVLMAAALAGIGGVTVYTVRRRRNF